MRKTTALSLAVMLFAVPAAAQMSSGSSSSTQSAPKGRLNEQTMPGTTYNNGMNSPNGTSNRMTRNRATPTNYNQKQHCMLSGNMASPVQASKNNSAAANHCPPGTKPAPQ